MEPTQHLLDSIYREKVLRARNTPPEHKLLAPARLYEYARGISIAGIKNQHPGATPEQIRELFRRRLKIARELDKRS